MRAAQRGQLTQSRSGCGPLASNSGTCRKNQARKRFLQWLVTPPLKLSRLAGKKPRASSSSGGPEISREKELDKFAARHVIRAKRNRFLKPLINGQERDEIGAKN